MSFVIGRGCAEVRHRTVCEVVCPRTVRKNCPHLLNYLEYLKIVCIHFDIGKSSPRDCRMKFIIGRCFVKLHILEKKNDHISCTQWNIVMKFCMQFDIDKM